MKTKFIKTFLLAFTGIVLVTGCTKNFDKTNTNTAAYSQSSFDPNYLLTTSQLTYTGSTDFSYETWRGNLIYCSTFMQGLSTVVGYWAGDKYLLNEGYTSAYWQVAYPEQVKNVVDLTQFTKDKPQFKNLYQISRLMRVLILQRITDLYGDVPYSQAGLGYYNSTYFPKYDAQQTIYNDMLKEVEEATNALDPAADKPSGDVYYKGNIDQWKRFGYSLMLRLAMRLTKADPTAAQAWATKTLGKTFTSNADNAYVKHDAAGGRTTINRNSQVLIGDGGQENYYVKWSKMFIDFLKASNDPRLGKVAVTQLYTDPNGKAQNAAFNSNPTAQKGMPNGKDLSGVAGRDISSDPSFTTFPDYSSPHPGMIKRDGVTFILTYAETELLLADAAQRFGVGGTATAATHYNNGVKAAMTYLSQYDAAMTVTDAQADAWLLANPYNAATGLAAINNQYWVLTCTMLDFYEAWSNWRRTGFPVLTPVVYPNNATNATIPRRFPYPSFEAASNPDNYNAARAAVPGGDNLTGRVWWDK
ncbi:MAG: SusD/RagB family nutrient-binding outer membrane lipoprotein [Chitinophagaceae bacterium]|nr:MAG: SusD/RagB family nutrient-binding outer membrane lipoprotein [Chitinophagaceae bacterium]